MAKLLWAEAAHAATFFQSSAYPVVQTTTGHKAIAYSDTLDWSVIFNGVMPIGYGGGNVSLRLYWASWTVTTGNCRWSVEFERMADNGNRTDTLNFGSAQIATDTPGSVLSSTAYTTYSALSNATIGSIAAGEYFRIRVGRTGSNGGDTMAGLAYLMEVALTED